MIFLKRLFITSLTHSKRPPAEQVAFSKSKECRRQSLQIKMGMVDTDHPQRRWLSFDSKTLFMVIGLLTMICFLTHGDDSEKIENFIYSIHAYDGYSYKKTFCIEDSNIIYFLENTTNILSARKAFIYYWPLLGLHRLDAASLNYPIAGKLEIRGNSIKTMLKESVLYTYTNMPEDKTNTRGATARSGREASEQYATGLRVLQGEDAKKAMEQYESLLEEYRKAEDEWNKKYAEYIEWKDDMVNKIRKARAEGKEVGGLVEEIQSNELLYWMGPERPNYLIMPLSEAFIINLPKGEYQIRLIDEMGSTVEGSEKKIVVFSKIRSEGVLYEYSSADTITKARKSKIPSSILYFDGSSDLYLQPYLQDEFNELYHEKLMVNEARANKHKTRWEKTKRLDNTWMEVKRGSRQKEIILEDVFYTNQNSQTGGGYEIVYWDNRPDAPQEFVNPSFRAFHIPLTKTTGKIDIKLTSFLGDNLILSNREIRVIRKSGALIIILILAVAPLIAMGYMLYKRQKLYRKKERVES